MSVLENDRGSARAGAIKMQFVPAQVDQAAGWPKLRRVVGTSTLLVRQSNACQDKYQYQLGCNHQAKAAKVGASKLLVSGDSEEQSTHAQDGGKDGGQYQCPTHGMKTCCDSASATTNYKKQLSSLELGGPGNF